MYSHDHRTVRADQAPPAQRRALVPRLSRRSMDSPWSMPLWPTRCSVDSSIPAGRGGQTDLADAAGIVLDDYIDGTDPTLLESGGRRPDRAPLPRRFGKVPEVLLPTIRYQLDNAEPLNSPPLRWPHGASTWPTRTAHPHPTCASTKRSKTRSSIDAPVSFLYFDAVFSGELSSFSTIPDTFATASGASAPTGYNQQSFTPSKEPRAQMADNADTATTETATSGDTACRTADLAAALPIGAPADRIPGPSNSVASRWPTWPTGSA